MPPTRKLPDSLDGSSCDRTPLFLTFPNSFGLEESCVDQLRRKLED